MAEEDPPKNSEEMIRLMYDAVFDKKDGLCVRVARIETYFKILGGALTIGIPTAIAIVALILH